MMTDLISFIHQTKWADIPQPAQRRAKLAMLDLIGTGIGGAPTRLSQIIRDHANEEFGGTVPMLFDHRCASAAGAALAGGMTIDALDGHDGFNPAKGHIGACVLPALLAMAYETGCTDGAEILTALTVGYEVGSRLAITLHDTTPDYHTSGAWAAVAVAAVGARLYRLDAVQTGHAMGIAEYHGPRSQMMRCIDHPTMLKDGAGWGSMAGVSAVKLAAKGFSGAPALTQSGPAWDDLGQVWRIMEQYFKPYPVCRWAQAPIEAVLNLRAQNNLTSLDVAKISISTFHESIRLATNHPKTTEEAQYSTSFPTAVAMVRGTVGPMDIADEALNDPEILRLSKTMELSEDASANAAFPLRRYAKVQLTLKSGQICESARFEPRWDHTNPPSAADIIAKFTDWTADLHPQAHDIQTAVMGLDTTGLAPLATLIYQPIKRATKSGKSR
ncbi:MmgE/PrpD family protein [Algirhabdus cladophorae]|uniref:MmgE/PrpD family protein n=1 Tax=Algirhabdus cladophorae TaxID=3377108 RepID=UPI003B84A519